MSRPFGAERNSGPMRPGDWWRFAIFTSVTLGVLAGWVWLVWH